MMETGDGCMSSYKTIGGRAREATCNVCTADRWPVRGGPDVGARMPRRRGGQSEDGWLHASIMIGLAGEIRAADRTKHTCCRRRPRLAGKGERVKGRGFASLGLRSGASREQTSPRTNGMQSRVKRRQGGERPRRCQSGPLMPLFRARQAGNGGGTLCLQHLLLS